MYNPQVLERALAQLNMKYQYVVGRTDSDEELAAMAIEDDRKRIEEYCGKPVRFDCNYTRTWGIYQYGMYGSLEACDQVSELVDPAVHY